MNFLIGLVTGLCIGYAPILFRWADLQRGYDATGGEIFIYLIPVLFWILVEEIKEWKEVE